MLYISKKDYEFLVALENRLGKEENWSSDVKTLWEINDSLQTQLIAQEKADKEALEQGEHLYEFVCETDSVSCNVYWVTGYNFGNALINYCKYTGEIKGAKMEAICSVCDSSAIELANEWLSEKIIHVHLVDKGTWVYAVKELSPYIITVGNK